MVPYNEINKPAAPTARQRAVASPMIFIVNRNNTVEVRIVL